MKVVLINGSPRKNGCTFTALSEVAKQLEKQGIETEIFQIGVKPIAGCLGCRQCPKLGKCIQDDIVNQFVEKYASADGFVFGSPVYYAAISGQLKCFMDRLFFSAGSKLAYKPAAAVVSCRRGGASCAFDDINKYFGINCMPIVSSQYWNQVHGNAPEEVVQDLEGMQTMRTLADNMAWLLKCIENGKKAGINKPTREPAVKTNYIR
ncbi:MAG: flavodoxin family protein [Bacteroidales bacterium]|nr:flavodoxin family protein [Bacteroidales bacterium]